MSNLIVKVQYFRGPLKGMTDEHNQNQPIITEIYCAENFKREDKVNKHPVVEFTEVKGDKRTNHRYIVNDEPFTGVYAEGEDSSLSPAFRVWVETLTGNRIESVAPNKAKTA